MIVLGLETSGVVCSVGLAGDDGHTAEERTVASRIHSEQLLLMVQRVLTTSGKRLSDVGAVAVSVGPGSFTGLRIGLSSAKGLCYSLGIPLAAIPTFDAIAEAVLEEMPAARNILVALDAKKGDFYCGRYVRNGDSLVPSGPTTLRTRDEVNEEVLRQPPEVFVGDPAMKQETGRIPTLAVEPLCRGDVVAGMGLRMAAEQNFTDIAACEPLYLKDFIVKGSAPAS